MDKLLAPDSELGFQCYLSILQRLTAEECSVSNLAETSLSENTTNAFFLFVSKLGFRLRSRFNLKKH